MLMDPYVEDKKMMKSKIAVFVICALITSFVIYKVSHEGHEYFLNAHYIKKHIDYIFTVTRNNDQMQTTSIP